MLHKSLVDDFQRGSLPRRVWSQVGKHLPKPHLVADDAAGTLVVKLPHPLYSRLLVVEQSPVHGARHPKPALKNGIPLLVRCRYALARLLPLLHPRCKCLRARPTRDLHYRRGSSNVCE